MLLAVAALPLVGAAASAALNSRPRASAAAGFGALGVSSALGAALAALVLLDGGSASIQLRNGIPALGTFSLAVDALSAFFLLVISLSTACVSIYSIGYMRSYEGKASPGAMGLLVNVFFLSMVVVVTSTNAVLYLIAWETMSLSSWLLVTYDHGHDPGSIKAGNLYLVMTHIGTALITLGLIAMWSCQAGDRSFDFSAFVGVGGLMPELLRTAAFLLLLAGLGAKMGIVPLHVWLPEAHPAAPSNISALMSGVMVKTAAYMLIRTVLTFLEPTEAWWGLMLMAVACLTALAGAIASLQGRDIKRALAYSTVENMGLILVGLGACMVFRAYYVMDPAANAFLGELAALSLAACMYHCLAHSLFKGLLFMGAGAVPFATGTRDMDRLGRLAKRMRATSVCNFVGALSLAAVPPFNGFVSEWLLLQSLLMARSIADPTLNLLMPAALAAVAVTGAIAAAGMVRVFGITFLGRPRSEEASRAKEVPAAMRAGMIAAAVLCAATGALSFLMAPMMMEAPSQIIGISADLGDGLTLRTPGGLSSLTPLAVAVPLMAAVLLALALSRRRQAAVPTWDCGTPLGPRNEYTSIGHSQPLVQVLSSFYRPHSRPAPDGSRTYWRLIYAPVISGITWVSHKIALMQRGSVQAYLAYIFIVLLVLLVVLR